MKTKLLLAILILTPLLFGVIRVQATETDLGNGMIVRETIITEEPILSYALNASCKTQSHKLSFIASGVEVAWIKLNGVNACWNMSCMTLQNSTRSKGAASGYSWVLLGAVIGGKSCTTQTFQKYSNAELHAPGNSGYLTHQEMNLRFSEPLDYNWAAWKTPVVWP